MAITDVRELRSFEYGESLGDKGKITLTGSVDLLALHNSTPDFGVLAEDSTSWPNLGNATIPKVGETRLVAGVLFTVKTRKMSYYKGDDADRAVKISVTYEAQDEESEQQKPEDQDADTWKRVSVTTELKECPLTDQGANGEFNASPKPPRNSARDPLDGLTENRCLARLKYTNTKVSNPSISSLMEYVNTTNQSQFLGAARRTMLCVGWNADYDDKVNLWNVSVEWLYDPKGHTVEAWDAGFNELVDGQRRAILDQANNPVSKPVPLNGAGGAISADLLVNQDFANQYMQKLVFYPYEEKNHNNIFNEGGI